MDYSLLPTLNSVSDEFAGIPTLVAPDERLPTLASSTKPHADSKPAETVPAVDPLFASEQRRFRRLEVTLPVWITTRTAYEEGLDIWELGFTRDISLGGAKITVPDGEEEGWRSYSKEKIEFVVRFEGDELETHGATGEAIPAFVRHVARDGKNGKLELGVQFEEGAANAARAAALKTGMATRRTRRTWQSAFVVVALVAFAGLFTVRGLNAEVQRRDAQISALQKQEKQAREELGRLSRPTLAATKSQGVDRAFQRQQVQARLETLVANMKRLNDPSNMKTAMAERERAAKSLGISLAPSSKAARVQLAVAFPYGYNWPLVLGDLETALGRKVPHVVVFRDWTQGFPDLDAREARARGKVLQVTWEPWHFSDPNAVKLSEIAAGRYDAYIDDWARGARSFGSEVWVRWGHEMNGNWYPWSLSANGQNATLWKAAYKRIHDRFRRAGASNVRFVWCFNAESVPAAPWNDALKTYPGDSYVDAVAVDGYNFGDTTAHSRWQSFEEIFAAPLARAAKAFPNKPLWIAETGCASTGGDKVEWLRDMDSALRNRLTKVESVTWFEAAKEADWRMVSSAESARAAKRIWGQAVYRRGEG